METVANLRTMMVKPKVPRDKEEGRMEHPRGQKEMRRKGGWSIPEDGKRQGGREDRAFSLRKEEGRTGHRSGRRV